MTDRRDIILFGDPPGLRQLLEAGGEALASRVALFCRAGTRPGQAEEADALSREIGCEMLVQPRPSESDYGDFRAALAATRPRLGLCNSYAMILRPEVLALFSGGVVNAHGAPLPECRGANPVEWCLIEDRPLAGAALHWMDDGIDTGPVIAQQRCIVFLTDTWQDIRARVHPLTSALLARHLPAILRGNAPGQAQDHSRATHYRRRSAADGAFSWDWPARRIYNLVRALVNPHPGAHAEEAGTWLGYDRYLSLPEVLLLKAKHRPGTLDDNGLRAIPLPDSGHATTATLAFDIFGGDAGRLGHAKLWIDDWWAGRGRLRLQGATGRRREMAEFVTGLAALELGLDDIVVLGG